MEKDGAIDLRNEFGQWQAGNGQPDCLVELRDSLPHYMEEMPKGSVFGFSLHGHTPELHNLIVRDKDNFDRVVETLKEAHRRGLKKMFVNHVVHKKNYKHLEEFAELMATLEVPLLRITKLVSSPSAYKNVPELLLDVDEIHATVRETNRLREKFRGRVVVAISEYGFGKLYTKKRYNFVKFLCNLSPVQMRHHCESGRKVFAVSSDNGNVFPCRFFLHADECKVGTITEDGELNLQHPNWKEEFHNNLNNIEEPCASCDILKWCGGACRATAMAEHFQVHGNWNPYAGLKSCPVAAGVYLEY